MLGLGPCQSKDDPDLNFVPGREGRKDQAVGKLKKAVERVIDKAKVNREMSVKTALFGLAKGEDQAASFAHEAIY